MYDSAVTRFKKSLEYTNDKITVGSVNSVIARSYLYKGDYSDASTFAAKGLVKDDTPFVTPVTSGLWYSIAGERFQNLLTAPIFKKYIDADPNEASRIKLESIPSTRYYFQAVYNSYSSLLKIMTWQENNLMRAELVLRGFGSGNAKELVNQVRASHNISPLKSVDLDSIYVERDKELFPSGNRLVDERRFNKWHLPAGTWEYLPIPKSERDENPNIN